VNSSRLDHRVEGLIIVDVGALGEAMKCWIDLRLGQGDQVLMTDS
jgi:hypothetical protein